MYKLLKAQKENLKQWLEDCEDLGTFTDMNGREYTLDDLDAKLIVITYYVEEHFQFEDVLYQEMFKYQDAFEGTDNCCGIDEIKAAEQYINELLGRDETFVANIFNKEYLKADEDPSAADDWDCWAAAGFDEEDED